MEFDVTCAILAGGESRRMGQGQDKAFIQVGGISLFDYVYDTCKELFSEIIIVTNQPQQFCDYRARIVLDELRGSGSLGGLYTGLMRASDYHTFCVACDMPFLKPELISYLVEKRLNYDIVMPITKEGLEPLHALYSKRCIEPIRKLLARGEFKISELLSQVDVWYCQEEELKKIDPTLASFTNVNTKKDLLEIQGILKGVQWEVS
jgi:molybdopterin-guanine dinucleotide biosynthesis protein A